MTLPDVTVLRPRPDAAVVELRGEQDIATSRQLHDVLTSLVEANELVVIDVSDAEFIDSTVIEGFMQAHKLAEARGSLVRLQMGTAPIVRKALEITGLLDLFECVTDRDDALRP
jgi:anti-sigma B factor antagonist